MNLKFGRKTLTVAEAQRIVLEHVEPFGTEWVPLTEVHGRRLAMSVTADFPVPHFRRSGVDGYAVHSADCMADSQERGKQLQVTETIFCGTLPKSHIGPGQAARIMTGAVVPDGADAVVMLEMTRSAGISADEVIVCKTMTADENITAIGQEIYLKECLLEAGTVVGPGEAAILATFGYDNVTVFRQPKIAIFSTGSELLPVAAPIEPGRIRDSNSYMLACQVREAGGIAYVMPILPDDPQKVQEAIKQALQVYDIILTTGGVSVGDKDVLVELFEFWDGTVLFNKVAMRPGSPTTVGLWQGKPLFALSGNPGASYVAFELLVRPYIRKLLGVSEPLPAERAAILEVNYAKGSAYPRYVRGTMTVDDFGLLKVRPAGRDKSSIMVSIKDTDCLIYIPAGGNGPIQGSLVRIIQLTA